MGPSSPPAGMQCCIALLGLYLLLDAATRVIELGTPVFSEKLSTACYTSFHNWKTAFWTAGQRLDPTTKTSRFVWRVTSSDANSSTTFAMDYTNWQPGEPNSWGGKEPCMNLMGVHSYRWNDWGCDNRICAVCELHCVPKKRKPPNFWQ